MLMIFKSHHWRLWMIWYLVWVWTRFNFSSSVSSSSTSWSLSNDARVSSAHCVWKRRGFSPLDRFIRSFSFLRDAALEVALGIDVMGGKKIIVPKVLLDSVFCANTSQHLKCCKDGSVKRACTLRDAHVLILTVTSWVAHFQPGGTIVTLLQSNWPYILVWASSFGLILEFLRRLAFILACEMSVS